MNIIWFKEKVLVIVVIEVIFVNFIDFIENEESKKDESRVLCEKFFYYLG